MKYLIKNGIVMNPAYSFQQKADVLIENGKVIKINDAIENEDAIIIHADGLIVAPGLVDLHVHFRDPGFTEKEDIMTGMNAAVAGGFTTVVSMPNTSPVVDNIETLHYVLDKAEKHGKLMVYSASSITKGIKGQELNDMRALLEAGSVTFIDDGGSGISANLLYEAFQKAAKLGVPITSNDKNSYFAIEGTFNRGKISEALGDIGIPAITEDLGIARDMLFAEDTGAKIHLQSVSTARGVQLIREAKSRGVKVTAEGSPHHFSLTDEEAIRQLGFAKVNPPLRTENDRKAVIQGLQDGTLDVIASDHAPHTVVEKKQGIHEAPFGLLGLETSVGVTFTHLVHQGKLSAYDAINKMTVNPAKALNLDAGFLSIGGDANIAIIDPALEWEVEECKLQSKSKNSPFLGRKLKGKAVLTFYKGNIVYDILNKN